ncbi:MAG: carboxypeptidase-like regulatory domain-containing protein, partial [Thermoanaerobaculia bacterium]
MRRLQQDSGNSRHALHRVWSLRNSSRSIFPNAPYTGAISGTVTEAGSGTPISGTYVEIYDSNGWYVTYGTTNSSGVYASNAGLATGDYYLRTYDYSGHINELYDDIQCVSWCTMTDGTPVSVTDGVTTSGIDFALTKGGLISGNITDEDTTNGIQSIEVDIYTASGGYVSYATTDSSGNYITTVGVPTGTYYARTYNANSYLDELYDDMPCLGSCTVTGGTAISVTIGVETTGIDFELTPGGAISGHLEDGITHLPIAFSGLNIHDAGGQYVSWAYTDSSGNYTSYAGLPTGTYFVRTQNGDGYLNELYDNLPCVGTCTVTDGTPVSVTLGATTPGIDFDLLTGGTIEGTVTEEGSSVPLDSGYVRIFDTVGSYLTSAYPDGSGDYETSIGLGTGTYYAATSSFSGYLDELYDDLPCHSGCTFTDGTPISVTAGATTSGIDFGLEQGGFIAGTVTETGSGSGLDTGYVTIYDSSGNWVVDSHPAASGAYLTYKT